MGITIKNMAVQYRECILSDLRQTVQSVTMTDYERQRTEQLWEQQATMAEQSYCKGAVRVLKEMFCELQHAPEDANVTDIICQKTIDLLEGM